jgi:anti-sigma B factor antagonist
VSLADVQMTLVPAALIAHVTGEIDMSNAEDVGSSLIGATPSEVRGVVLDLSGVEYLDSAGIYFIFGMRSSLQARGQSLILVIPPGSPVRAALRLAGAERAGETAEDVDSALRMLDVRSASGS